MRIVIAGAGNVGIHLAKLLSGENQDIILIDESEEKLSRLDSSFDLLTIQESPITLHGLKEAGAGDADLIVMVVDAKAGLDGESKNIIAGLRQKKQKAILLINKVDLVKKDSLFWASIQDAEPSGQN
jgi:trk system potassium uptake protein TrkA